MFIFGKEDKEFSISNDFDVLHRKLSDKKQDILKVSVYEIVNILSKLEKLWQKNSPYYNKAKNLLNETSSFSESMNELALSVLPKLFEYNSLMARLKSDFKNVDGLDNFVSTSDYQGEIKFTHLGILLHVTAGNVFLGTIDSIIMGILTKNINLIKLSSSNLDLPILFMKSLCEVDVDKKIIDFVNLVYWSSDDKSLETRIKNSVDGILAWGGEEMAKSYSENLHNSIKFIEHGPKVSFLVLTKKYLNQLNDDQYKSIARDICTWDQSACANAQNIFLESGIDVNLFAQKLSIALKNFNIERGELSDNEYVEILKEREKGLYIECLTGIKVLSGHNYTISYTNDSHLSPTALNRSVKLVSFNTENDLLTNLSPFKYYLQTCGLGCSHDELNQYLGVLENVGIKRFTKPGEMLNGLDGSPHDGDYSLLELTKVICKEFKETTEEFAIKITKSIPFYDNLKVDRFQDIPVISGDVISEFPVHKSNKLLNSNFNGSKFVFSTGGTTGSPKYCLYGTDEFNYTAKILSESYTKLGLIQTDVVLNLFMAGNLWSSFSAVQKALEYCNVTQLPLGGLTSSKEVATLINRFKVSVIFGLPSTILSIMNDFPNLEVKSIFYAGENFSKSSQEIIKKNWKVKEIHSAGYATVDVGPIGFQDNTCVGSEHILFKDIIHLEVIDQEAVVTSKIRKAMPILRYRTGDKVEIINESEDKIKFKLLGRIDQRINIWSSRIELSELEIAMKKSFNKNIDFQIKIKEDRQTHKVFDKLDIIIGKSDLNKSISDDQIIQSIYDNCIDLNNTISFEEFILNVNIIYGIFTASNKTGKVKKIIDTREIN